MRLRDHDDREAWEEFVQLYRPVIVRTARLKGMQSADAEDLAQQVLAALANAIERFEYDPDRAKFRTWLHRIATNAILNALQRGVPDRGSGDNDIRSFLEQRPARSDVDSGVLSTEYRREVFQQAAERIRGEFSESTWNSFWFTAVEGIDVDTVAKELGRTRGSIYASRSRVMKRLREEIGE